MAIWTTLGRILLHVTVVNVLVKAQQKIIGEAQKSSKETETSKVLRSSRHAEEDDFFFMKSARQANEIVRSLEMIENGRRELPVERRSDIAHVVKNNNRESSYRRVIRPAHIKQRYFVPKSRWPVSPHKIYRMSPESFTPLYQRKVQYRVKSRSNKPEKVSIQVKKVHPDKRLKNNATLRVLKSHHGRRSHPIMQEGIRVDFTTSHEIPNDYSNNEDVEVAVKQHNTSRGRSVSRGKSFEGSGDLDGGKTTLFSSGDIVTKSSGSNDETTEYVSGSGNTLERLEEKNGKIHSESSVQLDSPNEFSPSSGASDIMNNDKESGVFPTTDVLSQNHSGYDWLASGHENLEDSRNHDINHNFYTNEFKHSTEEILSGSGKENKDLGSAVHEINEISGFEFPLIGEGVALNSKGEAYNSVSSGDDSEAKDLMLLDNGSESGSVVSVLEKNPTKQQNGDSRNYDEGSNEVMEMNSNDEIGADFHFKKKAANSIKKLEKVPSRGDKNLDLGNKNDKRTSSGELGNDLFGEDDDNIDNFNELTPPTFSGSLDNQPEDDKGTTSGSNMDGVGKNADGFPNENTLPDGSNGEEVSSTSTSATQSHEVEENKLKESMKSDSVSGESGSGEGPKLQDNYSGMVSGDTTTFASGIPDAQKQGISVLPTNVSHHYPLSKSSSLRIISSQLGFPAHVPQVPSKSNDGESLPTAGSYSEEPDLIKAEENESIQSSPLFDHSSGEEHLDGSAVKENDASESGSGKMDTHYLPSSHSHSIRNKVRLFSTKHEKQLFGELVTPFKKELEKNKTPEVKHVEDQGNSKSKNVSYQSAEYDNRKLASALAKVEHQLVTRLKEIDAKNLHHKNHSNNDHPKKIFHPPKLKESHQKLHVKPSNVKTNQQMKVSKPSGQTIERIQSTEGKGKPLRLGSSPKLPLASKTKHHEELDFSGDENEHLESVKQRKNPVQKTEQASTASGNTPTNTGDLEENLNLIKAKGKSTQSPKEVPASKIAKTLLTELDKLKFGHEPGTVWHSSRFRYVKQCGLFVEQYNVTKTDASWNDNLWQPYPYLYDIPTHYQTCKSASWMNNTDLRGDVFLSFEVRLNKGRTQHDYARVCSNICCREERCRSWTLRFQNASTRNCPKNTFCCWLKSAVPSPISNQDYCTSGIVGRKKSRSPPPGMRSAVPLGGLGTGSFELRADGTFHEWTIENQSPGGSAKLNKGALDLAVFGVRVKAKGKSTSSLLLVHPPHGYPGVAALSYSGAFPVTKLSPAGLVTREVDMDLYAYPSFHPRDSRKSATPAVAFTLGLHNVRGKVDKEVAFMFNLPLGVQHDTIRAGSNFGEVVFTRLIKPSDCAYACDKMPKCVAWTTNGPTSCMLKNHMPLHSWAPGIVTGLKGEWSLENNMLTMERPGFFAQSGSTTLYAVDEKDTSTSFTVADNFQEIWKRFSQTGKLNSNSSVKKLGLYGAASLRTVLKPGESKSLTIIMSWYYPHRDISHVHVGNFYSNLFSSSKDAALHMRKDLLHSVKDISSWQSPFLSPLSAQLGDSLKPEERNVKRVPLWLQDLMMNSVSYWRSGFWTEDQRWRQWEALDCNKIDSVHNDMLRIMPYVLFYPEFVRDLLVSWSKAQLSDGMIEEALSTGCLGKTEKLDYAGGRAMGDGTALFVVGLYHYYLWTNDTEVLGRLWPAAKRAVMWSIGEATKGTDLPFRKVNGYDLLALDKYDHSIYNSVIYLLTLRAAEKLAAVKNEEKFGNFIKDTFTQASKRIDVELWDKEKGFYHAWWDMEYGSPAWIMSDSLYGQMWAYTLGLGELLDVKKLRSHLEKEVENNDTPFGLKAVSTERKELTLEDTSVILGHGVTSCRSLENITKHNSVWMGADANWATNMIHLGVDPSRALRQAQKALDHWRSTLNDQWNIHGMMSSSGYGQDGLPWANSHYSSHLVMWHIPLALSGQQYSAPDSSLTFWPRYKIPYELPFFTPTASGIIKASRSTRDKKRDEEMYTFTVLSGKLFLKRLAVAGSTYGKGEITLQQGDMVSWSRPQNTIRDILSQLKH